MPDTLLTGWSDRLARTPLTSTAVQLPSPRVSRVTYAQGVTFVQTTDQAQRMVQVAYESPVSVIGIDTEYRFRTEPVILPGHHEWRDNRSIFPFCISITILSGADCFRFVVDLRIPDLLPAIQQVLDLPVVFTAHHAKGDLEALWSLKLREPKYLWDTFLAEKALHLGRSTIRAAARKAPLDIDGLHLREEAEQHDAQRLTLHATAARYGQDVLQGNQKAELQCGFLTKPFDAPLTEEEITYAAADATLAALIHEPQRIACDRSGITGALDRVLMDWNVTVAEMEWTGVLLCPSRCRTFIASCAKAREILSVELAPHGIDNANSSSQIGIAIERAGLGAAFPKTKTEQICTSEDVLKEREHLHPLIPLVRRWRKVKQLSSDPAVSGQLIGMDGRVHADLRVLGADSGRTQSRLPNLMGIGRVFRPLVVASPGCGIGDADLSQIEIAVAAATFQDHALIQDFNRGDVYVSMAKKIFRDQVSEEDLAMADDAFKEKHKQLRDQMKPLVLGIIYGKSVDSIARDLHMSRARAQGLWDSFTACYSSLCQGMKAAGEQSIRRGYAYQSGLRRFRSGTGAGSGSEKRSLGNAYIQGTAALVFFAAGNRLRRLYREHDARLILPVHDAFVFEAPLHVLNQVAELTKTVMVMTVQEWFPELRPRVEVNIARPECWNYEEHADSLEQFAANPMLKL